jgi:hypothetical protein
MANMSQIVLSYISSHRIVCLWLFVLDVDLRISICSVESLKLGAAGVQYSES